MLNWNDLKYCLALSRDGSMTNAAKSLDANIATISRRIDNITQDVGVTLFTRNGQEWIPTETGHRLVEIAKQIEDELADLSLIRNGTLSSNTVIRLSVSLTIMQSYMNNLTAYRCHNSEKYNVALTIHDRSVAYSETDVSLRYKRPDHGNYMCKKVADVEVLPYISTLSDSFPQNWMEIDFDGMKFVPQDFGFDMPKIPKLRIEGLNLGAQSLIQGNFLGFFPRKFAENHPGLRRANNAASAKSLEIWMVYHQTRKLDPIVRAGIDLIMGAFHENSPCTLQAS